MTTATDVAAILDALPDGVLIVDQEGRITLANLALQQMTGLSGQELLGQRVEILVPEGVRDRHTRQREGFSLAPTLRPMRTGIDTRLRRSDGSDVAVEIQIAPIEWEGLTAFLASVRAADAS